MTTQERLHQLVDQLAIVRIVGAGGSPNQYPASYTITVTHP
jgi:hypothetical protein